MSKALGDQRCHKHFEVDAFALRFQRELGVQAFGDALAPLPAEGCRGARIRDVGIVLFKAAQVGRRRVAPVGDGFRFGSAV